MIQKGRWLACGLSKPGLFLQKNPQARKIVMILVPICSHCGLIVDDADLHEMVCEGPEKKEKTPTYGEQLEDGFAGLAIVTFAGRASVNARPLAPAEVLFVTSN